MVRFIFAVLALGLAVGFGPPLARLSLNMAKTAIHAHQCDQMSYAKFTKALLNAKPRTVPKKTEESK